MLIILAAYVFLCLYKVKIAPFNKNKYFEDYFSKDKTSSIKGIFILLVFFSHFNSYTSFTNAFDLLYVRCVRLIGQAMVAMFMFYSGFGVMESIRNKGKRYIQAMPKVRILTTWINFACIVVVYALLALAVGNTITIPQVILSLIGWDSVGNSNWYIFSILWLYLITFVAFTVCGNKKNYALGAWMMLILTGGYVVAMYFLKQSWWYDTVLCYCVGIFFSLYRDKIEQIINKNWLTWLLCFISSITVTVFITFHPFNIFGIMLRNIVFVVTVVILSMRVQFHNKVLAWCGANLFALYMLQRIPMIIASSIGLMDWNVYVSFVLCLVATFGLAALWARISKSNGKQSRKIESERTI